MKAAFAFHYIIKDFLDFCSVLKGCFNQHIAILMISIKLATPGLYETKDILK